MRFQGTMMKSTCLHMYWDEPFHPVRVDPIPLGASRVTLPPSCAAIEIHLPTLVLGRTLSPRHSPPHTLRVHTRPMSARSVTLITPLRLTRVAMNNDPPPTTPQTLSESFSHRKGPLVLSVSGAWRTACPRSWQVVQHGVTISRLVWEKASFSQKLKNVMALGQTLWSKDLRDIKDTAISTATAVEVAVS
ncbi:hypothetical protein E2C01_051486 [Portunus trituberculatus]|uniref:Uncharacterized protein n=1 Tax=Portunus trituberculatus TaxID=210409 RepID=A0A5B7GJB9_PORTR|nr:hypothetical protein [Portunus trituberculatus]